jgi:hypothetical protein
LYTAPVGFAPESRPLIFLNRFSDGKFNIVEQMKNLDSESAQPNGQLTSATAGCMDLLSVFFPTVVIQ